MAEWNDELARAKLGLPAVSKPAGERESLPCGECRARMARLRWHVATLASDKMEGRLTGSPGARLAGDYIANVFRLLGLRPAGDNGTYFQQFVFTSGISLGKGNELTIKGDGYSMQPAIDRQWRPLAVSANGRVEEAPVIFAGYGVEAPATSRLPAYNSYEDADVRGKWVLIFRGVPADVKPRRRLHLNRYADLRYKAAVAKARGALGLIVASPPGAAYKDELVRLKLDNIEARALPAISIDNETWKRLIKPLGNGLDEMLRALDAGEAMRATDIDGISIEAAIEIKYERKKARNVLARLPAGKDEKRPPLIIGAHYDHLGHGEISGSLAREGEKGKTHYGADDNASGVAALLEIAEQFAGLAKRGQLGARRDIIFAAWSGEEMGLLGSQHFVKALIDGKSGKAGKSGYAGETGKAGKPGVELSGLVAAYLNMDMIGRLKGRVSLYGVGSSTVWKPVIERANILSGLWPKLVENAYVPSDATSFYIKGAPVLHAFTGVHPEYSTPRDIAGLINYRGLAKITTLMGGVASQLARSPRAPDYIALQKPSGMGAKRRSGVFLGTIPDYSAKGGKGVLLSGVVKGGPASMAGFRGGDVIISLAGEPVGNIYDYVRILNMLKPGQPVKAAFLRDKRRYELTLVPRPRE
jgi:hypothetical protein